jgi:hypothetical protein
MKSTFTLQITLFVVVLMMGKGFFSFHSRNSKFFLSIYRRNVKSTLSLDNHFFPTTSYRSTRTFSSSRESIIPSDVMTTVNVKQKLKPLMIKYVSNKQSNEAWELYNSTIKYQRYTQDILSIVNVFLSDFTEASQIPILLTIINDIRSRDMLLPEIAYIALIRCYTAAKDDQQVWKYLYLWKEEMKESYSPKLRHFQPLIDHYANEGNFIALVHLIEYIVDLQVDLREEQMMALLVAYARSHNNNNNNNNINVQMKMHNLLLYLKETIFGLKFEQLQQLEHLFNSIYLQQLQFPETISESTREELVHDLLTLPTLIRDLSVLAGPVISTPESIANSSRVLAYNRTFLGNFSLFNYSNQEPLTGFVPIYADPYLPRSLRLQEKITFRIEEFLMQNIFEQRYLNNHNNNNQLVDQLSEQVRRINNNIDYSHDINMHLFTTTPPTNNNNKVEKDAAYYQALFGLHNQLPVRNVFCSPTSTKETCPHCRGTLVNVPLTIQERRILVDQLHSSIAQSVKNKSGVPGNDPGTKALADFHRWLLKQPYEYDYIIDGPNVAYMNQNYRFGRFSYGQVSYIVVIIHFTIIIIINYILKLLNILLLLIYMYLLYIYYYIL